MTIAAADRNNLPINLASSLVNGNEHIIHMLANPDGNIVTFDGPSIVGGNYASGIGGGGLTAFSADGQYPYSIGPFGQFPVSLVNSNGALIKSVRMDLPIAPTTLSTSDNIPVVGGLAFRYDPRQQKVKPEHALSWSKALAAAAATNNLQLITGVAGQLGWLRVENKKTATIYLKVFDVATVGAVTMGTTVPVLNIPIKASDISDIDFRGFDLQTGCVIAFTANPDPLDNTALAVNDYVAATITWAA